MRSSLFIGLLASTLVVSCAPSAQSSRTQPVKTSGTSHPDSPLTNLPINLGIVRGGDGTDPGSGRSKQSGTVYVWLAMTAPESMQNGKPKPPKDAVACGAQNQSLYRRPKTLTNAKAGTNGPYAVVFVFFCGGSVPPVPSPGT